MTSSLTSEQGSSISSAIERLVNLQLKAHFAYGYIGELCLGKFMQFHKEMTI